MHACRLCGCSHVTHGGADAHMLRDGKVDSTDSAASHTFSRAVTSSPSVAPSPLLPCAFTHLWGVPAPTVRNLEAVFNCLCDSMVTRVNPRLGTKAPAAGYEGQEAVAGCWCRVMGQNASDDVLLDSQACRGLQPANASANPAELPPSTNTVPRSCRNVAAFVV